MSDTYTKRKYSRTQIEKSKSFAVIHYLVRLNKDYVEGAD
jgi:hypothetical protein